MSSCTLTFTVGIQYRTGSQLECPRAHERSTTTVWGQSYISFGVKLYKIHIFKYSASLFELFVSLSAQFTEHFDPLTSSWPPPDLLLTSSWPPRFREVSSLINDTWFCVKRRVSHLINVSESEDEAAAAAAVWCLCHGWSSVSHTHTHTHTHTPPGYL